MLLNCLTCSSEITLKEDVMPGEIIECLSCGQEHEVVKENGVLKLDFAPEIEEDWGE